MLMCCAFHYRKRLPCAGSGLISINSVSCSGSSSGGRRIKYLRKLRYTRLASSYSDVMLESRHSTSHGGWCYNAFRTTTQCPPNGRCESTARSCKTCSRSCNYIYFYICHVECSAICSIQLNSND